MSFRTIPRFLFRSSEYLLLRSSHPEDSGVSIQITKGSRINPRYDISHFGPPQFPELGKVEELKRIEIENMGSLLVGEIYSLVDRVKHGVPLEGNCDACPGRYLSIEGMEKQR